MKKLYIDCTNTFWSEKVTGIPRVIDSILSRRYIFKENGFLDAVSVIQIGAGYYRFDLSEKNIYSLTKISRLFVKLCRENLDKLFRRKTNSVSLEIENTCKSENKDGNFYYRFIVYVRNKFLPSFYEITSFIDEIIYRKRKVDFTDSDVLFLPDSFWYQEFNILNIKKVKKKGTFIILLIHDVIPLTHPTLFRDGRCKRFEDSIDKIKLVINAYICNSRFTLSETKKNFNLGCESIPSSYFHLGSDFSFENYQGYNILHNKSYLMVGTIEPRKNHLFVLKVFHSLWDSGFDVKLVIAGKDGWKCEDVFNVILNSRYFGVNLFLYQEATDDDLRALYHGCKALIIASEIEGFGLPLVEAISLKKTVFASDIPVFREVAGEYPFYFDLSTELSLIELIKKNESNELVQKKIDITSYTWDDSVQSLAQELSQLTYASHEKPISS